MNSVHRNSAALQSNGADCSVHAMLLDMKAAARDDAETISQALYGERATVIASAGDWVQIRLTRDGYSGWVRREWLRSLQPAATHRVSVRRTLLFASPDIKGPVLGALPFTAELALDTTSQGPFGRTHAGAFVWRQHCRAIPEPPVASAVAAARELFMGAPYLWGGRSPDGCDCSGLVQVCAFVSGVSLPRDSHQQLASLCHDVEWAARQRDDLVFWPGHVGLLLDPEQLLHATAHTMQTVIEPIETVNARAGAPIGIRRLIRQSAADE